MTVDVAAIRAELAELTARRVNEIPAGPQAAGPMMALVPVHNPQTRHCDCIGDDRVDPDCCVCTGQPCERGQTRQARHALTLLIKDLSPTTFVAVPF